MIENKPGVMIYFDMLPALESLSNTDKGILFEAILRYGKYRVESKLTPKTQVIWPLIRFRLDTDEMRYANTVVRRRYAAYVRWTKQQGKEPVDFIAWQEEKGYIPCEEEYIPLEPVFLPNQ